MEDSNMSVIYQIFIGFVIPVVVSGMKKVEWPSSVKFGLVFVLSLLAASIVPLARLTNGAAFSFDEMLQALVVIFTTTQVFYKTAFKMLSIESLVNPHSALLSAINEQVASYVSSVDLATVKSILDPNTDHTVVVEISDIDGPESVEYSEENNETQL
jgi:hypothetical protein